MRARRLLPASLAAAAILAGCGADGASDAATGGEAASAARPDALRGVRTPDDVCRALPAARLRAAMLDPTLLPKLERTGLMLHLAPRRVRLLGRGAPACVYAMRRPRGTGFEFLTVIVARGGDQAALRERLRRGGTGWAVEVDVAGRAASYDVSHPDADGTTTPTQLAVPARDATLIVRPGITFGADDGRGDGFSADRRRDSATNIARAVLGEHFVRAGG